MSKKPLPKIKRLGAKSCPGSYGFDNGLIAFGNPLDGIGKKAAIRQQAAKRWKERGNQARKERSTKSDFHRKHG